MPDQLACSRSSSPTATFWPEITPTRRCSSRLSSEYFSGFALRHRALQVLRQLAELGGLLVGDPLRGLDGAERLQGHPALGDRDGLFGGDDPHPRAPVGDPLDEALGGEVEQRGPQRLPRHPERPRQLLLDEPLTGRDIPAEDRLPERGEGVRPRRLPGPRPTGRIRRHTRNATNVPPDCQQSVMVIVDNIWGINQVSAPGPRVAAWPPWDGGRPVTWPSSSRRRGRTCAGSARGTPCSSP